MACGFMHISKLTEQWAGRSVQSNRPAINRRATEQRPLKGAYDAPIGPSSPLQRALLRSLGVNAQAVMRRPSTHG